MDSPIGKKVNGPEIQKWTALKSKSGRPWNQKVDGSEIQK